MARLLHKKALFFSDALAKETVVHSHQLNGKLKNDLNAGILTDMWERFLLQVKLRKGKTYFFSRRSGSYASKGGRDNTDPKEKDPRHDTERDSLVLNLSKTAPAPIAGGGVSQAALCTLEIYTFSEKKTNKKGSQAGKALQTKRVLARLNRNDYQWAAEVRRFSGERGIIIHDVFGRSNTPQMSIRRPNIAIEVVLTHLPSVQTLTHMFAQTRTSPLIILFDFIELKRKLFETDFYSTTINIRANVFMMEGVIYNCDQVVATWQDQYPHLIFEQWARSMGAKQINTSSPPGPLPANQSLVPPAGSPLPAPAPPPGPIV